jgi:hypothetical protein
MLLPQGQWLARVVERPVSFSILLPKVFVRIPRIPEIKRHIDTGTGKFAQEASLAVVRVAAEELRPIPIRAMDSFKATLKAWLDIVLPEGYKHRCPIFCFRSLANLIANSGERLCCPAECSNPSGYMPTQSALQRGILGF